jgi:hypothetical protein
VASFMVVVMVVDSVEGSRVGGECVLVGSGWLYSTYLTIRVPSVIDHHAKSYVEAQHTDFQAPKTAFVDLAE